MKPLNRKNYGSIPHLSTSKLGDNDKYITEGQEIILTQKARDKNDTILVFEKYDGSNVGIAKKDGNIYAITRSGYLAKTSPYKQHHVFSQWVRAREPLFNRMICEGERLAAEWLYQAHGLKYRILGQPIIFFDYFGSNNKRKPFSELERLDLPIARLLHKGGPVDPLDLIDVLNQKTPHIMSEENPEGMVYRVERNGRVDFLAKWVRPDFVPGVFCVNVSQDDLVYNCSLFQAT